MESVYLSANLHCCVLLPDGLGRKSVATFFERALAFPRDEGSDLQISAWGDRHRTHEAFSSRICRKPKLSAMLQVSRRPGAVLGRCQIYPYCTRSKVQRYLGLRDIYQRRV